MTHFERIMRFLEKEGACINGNRIKSNLRAQLKYFNRKPALCSSEQMLSFIASFMYGAYKLKYITKKEFLNLDIIKKGLDSRMLIVRYLDMEKLKGALLAKNGISDYKINWFFSLTNTSVNSRKALTEAYKDPVIKRLKSVLDNQVKP